MMENKLSSTVILSEYQLFDVRPAQLWEAGVIPGSILLDLEDEDFINKFKSNQDPVRPAAIICTAGTRSEAACKQILADEKSIEITNLLGGIDELLARGYLLSPTDSAKRA